MVYSDVTQKMTRLAVVCGDGHNYGFVARVATVVRGDGGDLTCW